MRGGHAYAEGAALHGAPPERHGVAATRRALLWGALLPALALLLSLVSPWFLLLLLAYPLQLARIAVTMKRGWRFNLERAFFLVLGKFPELLGQIQFWAGHKKRRGSTSFDYKS